MESKHMKLNLPPGVSVTFTKTANFVPNPNPPHPTITPEMIQWLANGRRGSSSETMFSWLTGVNCFTPCYFCSQTQHPCDASDFERCVNLLNQCPTLRPHLATLAELSDVWAGLVSAWSMLEVCLAHGEKSRVNLLIDNLIEINRT